MKFFEKILCILFLNIFISLPHFIFMLLNKIFRVIMFLAGMYTVIMMSIAVWVFPTMRAVVHKYRNTIVTEM